MHSAISSKQGLNTIVQTRIESDVPVRLPIHRLLRLRNPRPRLRLRLPVGPTECRSDDQGKDECRIGVHLPYPSQSARMSDVEDG